MIKRKRVLYFFLLSILAFTLFTIFRKSKSCKISEGKYPFSVQFVSDKSGQILIQKLSSKLYLTGFTKSNDSTSAFYIRGEITKNWIDSFIVTGKIDIKSKGCCGCQSKVGNWTFRRMNNRSFFRLKEREKICDSCHYYIDIHLN